jgi:hypothetical protein
VDILGMIKAGQGKKFNLCSEIVLVRIGSLAIYPTIIFVPFKAVKHLNTIYVAGGALLVDTHIGVDKNSKLLARIGS